MPAVIAIPKPRADVTTSFESGLVRVTSRRVIIRRMPLQPVDQLTFRRSMSMFASGVTVITTGEGKRRWGMTVASFASLSLDPPLVVICVENRVETRAAVERTRHFAVNVLADDQAHISSQFASRMADRFEGIAIEASPLGDPYIQGAVCQIQCRVYDVFPGGDHTIIVGEVLDSTITDRLPLLYWQSQYQSMKGRESES